MELKIENGVLRSFRGDGTELIIPDAVTEIGQNACFHNNKIKKHNPERESVRKNEKNCLAFVFGLQQRIRHGSVPVQHKRKSVVADL